MSNFTIGEAWSEAMGFLKANAQMLFLLIAGAAVASLAMQFSLTGTAETQSAQMEALMKGFSTGNFGDIVKAGNDSGATGAMAAMMIVVGLAAGLIQSTAHFAALRLGLARDDADLPSSLIYGLIASLLTFLVWFGISILAAIVLIIPLAIIGGGAAFLGAGAGASGGGFASLGVGMIFLFLLLFVVMLYLVARLCIYAPCMAATGSTNPIAGLKQSWALTRECVWSIIGYYVLLFIAALVLIIVLSAVVLALSSAFGPLVSAILSTLLVSVPMTVLGISISAGIYRTLVPYGDADVFA